MTWEAISAEMMISEVTWTLNKKSVFFLSALLIMSSFAAADYYYERNSGFSTDTGFSAPQYDSQEEILTQLVAPFLLIAIILQIGFDRALRFAFVGDQNNDLLGLVEDNRPSNVRKQSTLMAVAVAGMLVPTSFFQLLNSYIAILFGGITYIFFAVVVIAFLMVLWSGISS